MALSLIKNLIKQDVAIDLGTANSLIYLQREGIVLNEPTVIAGNSLGEPVAVGRKAKAYLGKTPPGMIVKRPMKAGAVDDVDAVSIYLRRIVEMARSRSPVLSSKVVICVPSKLTQVEKRAVLDAAEDAGFKKVYLLEEAMAAAIGAGGVDVAGKVPFMVVDIGGGTTEVAVISEMAYMVSESRRIGGNDLDEALCSYMLRKYGLRIGPNTAERLKWEMGTATGDKAHALVPSRVGGQDVAKQIPAVVEVTPMEILECISPIIREIGVIISEAYEALDAGVQGLVSKQGIFLTGGSSLLRGFDAFLQDYVGVKMSRVESPLETVVLGAGKALSSFNAYASVFSN